MQNETEFWQVILAWIVILIPIALFDLAALKWGVVTSGDKGGRTILEV